MGETALLIFTLCLQAAIGTLILITLEKQLNKEKQFKILGLITAALSIIGIFASFLHLGHPQSAINALSNVGKSWLSNEVLLASAFTGIAVLYALAQYLKPDSQSLNTVLRWAGSLVGLATVFSMAKVYTSASVPVWKGANTFVDFYTTAIAVGGLIFLATSYKEIQDTHKRNFALLVLAAVVIQAAVAVPYAFALTQKGMAAQASAEILSGLATVIGLKWLLALGGAALLLWSSIQKGGVTKGVNAVNIVYLAGAALIVGEIIGRYVFYAAMVVSSIGLT
ncbi:DmsC/YnfH family molybdoenzyme membrane anchor subunit [Desulfosporosinus sp. PR]|uniref:dimethyl sulfoxide reductase anchor subunit family protein n=1 Tax=Candidatus Desulfosporosinus nitrosoreducens TaxID=3401928 RepID=UPI0027F44BA3|nr:DmsC/YnfH family molybdoenzyme membrane anchor subunit [Desulfosporosinus sp. PR]MDQ7092084.1 DmsC/YnfH family molybdoenzyme membrane anchor subunit [Desulfosporosinus sp. PR]